MARAGKKDDNRIIMFQVGEHDENMYIVDSGSINVFSTTRDPRTNEVQTHVLKKVRQGEAIFSLLSFVEYLGGRRKLYKTVSAKATEETRVIKISFKSFKKSFDNYPETLAKVVQVVMVRLQRVTLLALHQVSYRGVFRTFELRVLTVIDCPKIAGAKGQ